jgi:hypothetical protein
MPIFYFFLLYLNNNTAKFKEKSTRKIKSNEKETHSLMPLGIFSTARLSGVKA